MKPKEELYSLAMERALLWAALTDNASMYDLSNVQSTDFHNAIHAKVWRAIGELRRAGEYVDGMTVKEALDAANSGVTFSDMAHIAGTEANTNAWETYADRVREYAHRRKIVDLAGRAAKIACQSNGSYSDDLAALRDELSKAVDRLDPDKEREAAKTLWTVAELYAADFPTPQWAVPGLVPVGLSFLAGRPKVGKSWLALQIAHAVGAGGMALNQRVSPGKALYLVLEDGPRRLRERLQKQDVPAVANITFATSWRCFTDGGLNDIKAAINEGSYRLVVIDTLARALGRADQSDLADMTVFVGELQQIAIAHDMAVLVIDHHRKPTGFAGDPIDDIVGSTAKSAVADAVLGLWKEQGKAGAVLKVTGRDLEAQELALSWDAACGCWQLEGTVEEVSLRGNKSKVLDALRTYHEGATLTELASVIEIAKGNLLPVLNDLVNSGHVKRLPKQGREVPYMLSEVA